jgi:hypothetical protein
MNPFQKVRIVMRAKSILPEKWIRRAAAFLAVELLLMPFQMRAQGEPIVEAWTQQYTNGGAKAIGLDDSGNVYVAGPGIVIKYSHAGALQWATNVTGFSPAAWAIGRNGMVYITGSRPGGPPSFHDYVTEAYSSDGEVLWTNLYSASTNSDDVAQAVAVDTNGNAYVTGYSVGAGFGDDFVTVAYSSTGLPLWTNRYDGLHHDDLGRAITVDLNGNVIVTGNSYSDGSGNSDYGTIKYSSAGVPLWTNRYDGPAHGFDLATAVKTDKNGNVFVTGYSSGFDGPYDYATIKYSSAGLPLWTNRLDDPGSDHPVGMAVDENGNVFVTGYSDTDILNSHYLTVGYSSAGVPLWTNRYDGPGNTNDIASGIGVDGSGNVYVTGSSPGVAGDDDYATLKYSSAGGLLWTRRYNGANSYDDATALAVTTNGTVFVTGTSDGYPTTVAYAPPTPLAIQKTADHVVLSWANSVFSLQSAPSPAGVFTNIPNAASPFTNDISSPQEFFMLNGD